ncbi:ABC transporter ATP-binding protein [Desulfitibacter alkalitolerans]|uniref:ABC transporter ATP-binding protein n=1 Tax=Desulfitibacter alkalitolerans TaxID=264641 RepID=UPI000684E461|nr:ABC transporter ATP-binding protein [Desulfitibacter alkalitolerans]
MAKVVLKNLVKRFSQETIIKNVNLEIEHGEFVALVGPSGCGKTTTLKLLSGLLIPEEGQILLDKEEVTFLPAEKRDVVMVFQDHLLFPHLTVGENVAFGLKMLGISKRERLKKARVLLELVRLPDIEQKYPAQLSGGQQQRVALARALALEPKVLLLDEPLSNLDPNLREEMRELILQIHRKLNMTIIFVTHDQNEAMLLADKIAVMLEGQIIQFDTPYNLYNCPVNKKIASMFGTCNFLDGIIQNNLFHLPGRKIPMPHFLESGEVTAYVRAEHIEICLPPQKEYFSGIITDKKFSAGQSIIKISTDMGELTAVVNNHIDTALNTRVYFKIEWNRVWFQKRGKSDEGVCHNSYFERSQQYLVSIKNDKTASGQY